MFLPLYIDLKDRKVLVLGLGAVGERRAKKLRDFGASVTGIDKRKKHIDGIKTVQKRLTKEQIPSLEKYFLVITALNKEKLNTIIARKAKKQNTLVNHAAESESGDVIFPAVVKTQDELFSVTTTGENPGLAKRAMELLNDEFSRG